MPPKATPSPDAALAGPGQRSLLEDLRELARTTPVLARTLGWQYLRELGSAGNHRELEALFSRGWAPEGPDGALESCIVVKPFGVPEALLANWRGRTFDAAAGTGFNRFAPIARLAMPLIAPRYRGLRTLDGELVGFHFDHRLDTGLVDPKVPVRALDYAAPEYRNPSGRIFAATRIRDEIVELLSGLYLGRALLTMHDGEIRKLAWFALREFTDESTR